MFFKFSPLTRISHRSAKRGHADDRRYKARERQSAQAYYYVEPFVLAERRRFGPAPHSLGEVGWMHARSRGLVRIAGRHLLSKPTPEQRPSVNFEIFKDLRSAGWPGS